RCATGGNGFVGLDPYQIFRTVRVARLRRPGRTPMARFSPRSRWVVLPTALATAAVGTAVALASASNGSGPSSAAAPASFDGGRPTGPRPTGRPPTRPTARAGW